MSIVLLGATSGSCTLQEQAVAGTTTLTLPTVSGTIITTGSSGQSIPKAALPTGSVLQVVNGTAGYVTTTSATAVDTGLTATITPTASTSKVLVLISLNGIVSSGNQAWNFDLTNGSNTLLQNLLNYNVTITLTAASYSILHSPATTSATTYKVRFYIAGGATLRLGDYSQNNSIATITLLEIAA